MRKNLPTDAHGTHGIRAAQRVLFGKKLLAVPYKRLTCEEGDLLGILVFFGNGNAAHVRVVWREHKALLDGVE